MEEQIQGLTEPEVQASRARYGDNVIPDSEPTTFWDEFRETFNDPMIRILLVIVAIMLGMYAAGHAQIYEPLGTIVAVLIVAVVTAKTGVASDTKYRELKESARHETCKVHRDHHMSVIPTDDVVVGDMVVLQAGDKVPADGVLVRGALRVNNAALNGEVEECRKTAAAMDTAFPEKVTGDDITGAHLLFRGTVVFDGEGVLAVHRTGLRTMMGQMAEEMAGDEPDSPLKVKLSKLAKQISVFGYASAAVIVVLYMAYFISAAGGLAPYGALGWERVLMDVVEAVSLAILIVVCAVPEGLPLMISLVLMQNTSRMLDHNVLVRKAVGIETAGSLNILFSDKTGTITKGQLEVVKLLTPDGEEVAPDDLPARGELHRLVSIAVGQNTASMFDDAHRVIGGNATDQALTRFLGEDAYNAVHDVCTVTDHQGFNSANKFSQAVVNGRVYYKGAPERLMVDHDGQLRVAGEDGQVHTVDRAGLDRRITAYAAQAMRVLALAYSEQPMTVDRVNDDAVLIGLVAIRDDVRPEAREAIREVRGAGIQVVMITGDRRETAVAIARDAGLLEGADDMVLDSSQLASMDDDQLKRCVRNVRVIARALPTDKSRMVRICQEMNLVVGMTGDGVNDSPALKRADVGFAMGSGTEAAKEAGEIVVLDDNFRSIKDAVLYGRTIYHNILKFCKFQLVINVAAVAVTALSPFFGVAEPLKVVHLLFINLVMDSLGALMLGNEPALARYMHEPPRRRDESVVSKPMGMQILFMAAYLLVMSFVFLTTPWFAEVLGGQPQLYTAYFVLFVLSALFNGVNVRDDGVKVFARLDENPSFIKVWLTIAAVQALIVNAALVPLEAFRWIGAMFACTPFSLAGWALVFVMAATVIPVDLLRKVIVRRMAG